MALKNKLINEIKQENYCFGTEGQFGTQLADQYWLKKPVVLLKKINLKRELYSIYKKVRCSDSKWTNKANGNSYSSLLKDSELNELLHIKGLQSSWKYNYNLKEILLLLKCINGYNYSCLQNASLRVFLTCILALWLALTTDLLCVHTLLIYLIYYYLSFKNVSATMMIILTFPKAIFPVPRKYLAGIQYIFTE